MITGKTHNSLVGQPICGTRSAGKYDNVNVIDINKVVVVVVIIIMVVVVVAVEVVLVFLLVELMMLFISLL